MLRLSADITTGRQAAEWGMRTLQGAYARLKSCMTADKVKRARILRVCFALHNFQVRRCGITQIGQAFSVDWEDGVLGAKDRVALFHGM